MSKDAELIIDSKQVDANLRRIKDRVPQALLQSMRTATEYLRGYVVKYKLTGQYLKAHSGGAGLAGSIKSEAQLTQDGVVGRVGSNLKYARVHELGIWKGVKVKAHSRNMNGKLVSVREHMRMMKLVARHYLLHSLQETTPNLQRVLGQEFWSEVTSK